MITVYQIPVNVWMSPNIEPRKSELWGSRIIAEGDTHQKVLRQLVVEINEEHIDTENCWLYIKEQL